MSETSNTFIKMDTFSDFHHVLRIPFFYSLKDCMVRYFAILQSYANPAAIVSIIYGVLLVIQMLLSVLLYPIAKGSSNDPTNEILRLLSIFLTGGAFFNNTAAFSVSTVFLILDASFIIFVVWRSFAYKKTKVITEFEETVVLTISKYCIPISIPIMITCLPIITVNLFSGIIKGSQILLLVFSMVVIIISLYLQFHCFIPRVMFAPELFHEWDSSISTIITGLLSLSTYALIASQYLKKQGMAIMALIQMISYIFIAVYVFLKRCYVNPTAVKIISTLASSLSLSCIVNIINIFIKIPTLLSIIIFIVFAIIVFIIYNIVNTNLVASFITKIDECEEDITCIKSSSFAIAIKGTLDKFLPSVFSFESIKRKLQCKENNDDLLYVYARIVSSFPCFNDALHEISGQIKYSHIKTRKTIELQIGAITKRRITSITPEIVNYFQDSENSQLTYQKAKYKFWDNVIENNRGAFWGCVNNINAKITEVENEISQMLQTYENTPEVITHITKFCLTSLYDYDRIPFLNEALDLLKSRKPAHSDRPMANFLRIFPGIVNVSSKFTEDIDVQGTPDDVDFSEYEVKRSTYDMIKNTRSQSTTCLTVYLAIATLAVTVLAFLLYNMFRTDVLNNIVNCTNAYADLSELLFNIPKLSLMLYSSSCLRNPKSPIKATDEVMKIISPNWFGVYDDIPRFSVSFTDIQQLETDIRGNIEHISQRLSKLDTSIESIKRFIDTFYNGIVPETNKTIQISIIEMFMAPNVNEQFVDNVLGIYRVLKQSIISFAEDTKFDYYFDNITIYTVILVLANVVLISIPSMFFLFFITTQMNEISDAFSTIPSSSIREALNYNKDGAKETNQYSSLLTIVDSESYSLYMFGSMSVTIFPVVILTTLFYAFCMIYVTNSNENCKNAAYTRLGSSTVRVAFFALMQAFENSYNGTTPLPTKSALVKKSMNLTTKLLDETKFDTIQSTLKSATEYDEWLKVENNYRTLYPPLDESFDKIPAVGADFERLCSQRWSEALDNLIFCISVTEPGSQYSLRYYYAELYFLDWMYKNREVPFYDVLTKNLIQKVLQNDAMIYITVALALFIIASFIAVICIFYTFKRRIDEAMLLLMQLSNETILTCSPVMDMITKGRFVRESNNLFQTSNAFINNNDCGIAKIDSSLDISEENPAFEEILPGITNIEQLNQNPDEDIPTLPLLTKNIREAFCGIRPHSISKISALINENVINVEIEIIAITENRLAMENDNEKVTQCIIVVKDVSELINDQKEINCKRHELDMMFKKVLPENIVKILQTGENSISYSVHSITLGDIRVRASKRFSFTSNDPHIFYNKVYQVFDKIMENYPVLCKVRTIAHHYTFAGGIFMDVNKPEKHADEAIKFLLEVIHELPNISKLCETEVSVNISVHTGGPVISGVMSIEMPSFVVLGKVHELVDKLNLLKDDNVIHITRAVYELIFSSGFKIVESEAIEDGNATIATYTVFP